MLFSRRQSMSTSSWVTITSGKSGTGIGTVKYTIPSNRSYNSRDTTITVAGTIFKITQKGVTGR